MIWHFNIQINRSVARCCIDDNMVVTLHGPEVDRFLYGPESHGGPDDNRLAGVAGCSDGAFMVVDRQVSRLAGIGKKDRHLLNGIILRSERKSEQDGEKIC